MTEQEIREWLLSLIDERMACGDHISKDLSEAAIRLTEEKVQMFRELIANWRLNRHIPERI